MASRAELEAHIAEIETRFGDGPIERPPFWGGYRVVPARIEFWQGRVSRLHDRFCYMRQADESWSIDRLAP